MNKNKTTQNKTNLVKVLVSVNFLVNINDTFYTYASKNNKKGHQYLTFTFLLHMRVY